MRNLILLQDGIYSGLVDKDDNLSNIVSICRDIGSTSVFTLTDNGCLSIFKISDQLKVESQLSLCSGSGEKVNSWFDATVVGEIGAVVCISHSGTIISVREDPETGLRSDTFEQEGDVDGGIAAAGWNPDASNLVIVTNNDSILLMTAYWDVLEEVPMPSRLPGSPCSVSWRGDGEYLTILCIDKELQIPQVRVYSKKLELVSTGRNVADGAGSLLKGLGSAVAYATNGSLIALSQQQGKSKLQIAFIEKNGLRHLEFDVHCPNKPEGSSDWEVSTLHWDLPSTLLAVGLSRVHNNETIGAVQLYYRGNYHWYLKQQWVESGLKCLGFDSETVGRLFMVQSASKNVPDTTGRSGSVCVRSSLRIADIAWDVTVSGTSDGSVAVTDGSTLLLTPLALNNVPPPMSMYKQQLPSACRHSFFWPRPGGAGWGLGCLLDDNRVHLIFSDKLGKPTGQLDIDVSSIISSLSLPAMSSGDSAENRMLFVVRGIACSESPRNQTQREEEGGGGRGGQEAECESEDLVSVVLYGSWESRGWGPLVESEDIEEEGGPAGQPDEILTFVVCVRDGSVRSSKHISNIDLSEISSLNTFHSNEVIRVSRIVLWPDDPASLAVSLISGHDSFGVYRLCVLGGKNTDNQIENSADCFGRADHTVSTVSCPPETCVQIAVIPAVKAPTPHTEVDSEILDLNSDVIIGLTSRGKLYCGETLLVAGVSSFTVNNPLQVLLYISTGTKPLLHFCSFAALRSLDPLKAEAWEDQQQAAAMLGAEPRPVERGARLVMAASGSPKVVLQMPRGNLEGIEPRPLIFLKARELIDSLDMQSCLLLLRRQKVDLNYLIDYNPVVFLSQVGSLVKRCLASNPDLLSLLISSLEPGDTTSFKYPTYAPDGTLPGDVTWRERLLPSPDFYSGLKKVNIVCTAVRDSLLGFLNSTQGPPQLSALYPALCTYAKQSPPLLVEALSLIKTSSSTSTSSSSSSSSSQDRGSEELLAVAKVPAAIKYLAFLAEGSALFDAALGRCDFDMARAVARQCQMDPKAYLPLLKGFEDLGISRNLGPGSPTQEQGSCWEVAHMHFEVAVHLKRFEEAVEWSVKLFLAVWRNTFYSSKIELSAGEEKVEKAEGEGAGVGEGEGEGEGEIEGKKEMMSVMDRVLVVIGDKEKNLFAFALPLIARFLIEISTEEKEKLKEGSVVGSAAARSVLLLCKDYQSRVCVGYGDFCVKKLQYTEAVAAYLKATPPRATEAVRVARLMGDWQLALMIAGRYGSNSTGGGGLGGGEVGLDPKRVAFELVSAFRESLEQGESGIFDYAGADSLVPTGLGDMEEMGGMDGAKGKALEAAQLSVEYCDDAETAVSILLLSSKWTAAAQVALKANRRDLLLEEIAPAVRVAAHTMIAALPSRSERQAVLVAELSVLWADPHARLVQVASTEPTLVAELNGGHLNADGTVWKDVEGDDTKSEFSIVSRQSGASYVSTASRSSVKSSASSSVSILSNLSIGSSGGKSSASTSAFSIDGLDHSLLSRGTAKGPGGSDLGGKKEAPRKYKRRQRKTCKGEGGRDLWGLRRESAVCAELWTLAQVSAIARSAKDLCDVLSLFALGDEGDITLACELQRSVDVYVKCLQSQPPPVAPLYPPQWMGIRQLVTVCRYQETMFPAINLSDLRTPLGPGSVTLVKRDKRVEYNDNDNDDGDGDDIPALARQLHFNLIQESKQNSTVDTWWKTAADGISLWQSYRRIVLES